MDNDTDTNSAITRVSPTNDEDNTDDTNTEYNQNDNTDNEVTQETASDNIDYMSILNSELEDSPFSENIVDTNYVDDVNIQIMVEDDEEQKYSVVASTQHSNGEPVREDIFVNHINMLIDTLLTAYPEDEV